MKDEHILILWCQELYRGVLLKDISSIKYIKLLVLLLLLSFGICNIYFYIKQKIAKISTLCLFFPVLGIAYTDYENKI